MKTQSIVFLMLSVASGAASAGGATVPEPGTLELLAVGVIAAVAMAVRSRKK